MQHLRRSPGGMYYSVFETETGGLFYLFFHNLMEYPYYQDHFKEEGWEPEHYFLMRWSFYVDQLYSFERFAHIAEGSPAEELYALCPWARGITHRFFILLTDGILAVTIAQEKIQALYYTDEFLLYEYSGDEAWIGEDYTPEEQGLTCDFRIWEFDLPKT